MFKLFSHINRLITKFKIMIVGCNHPHSVVVVIRGWLCMIIDVFCFQTTFLISLCLLLIV